jgi:hypothetical protein
MAKHLEKLYEGIVLGLNACKKHEFCHEIC